MTSRFQTGDELTRAAPAVVRAGEQSHLPPDLVRDGSRRLVAGMLLVAAACLIYFVLDATIWPEKASPMNMTVLAALVVGSCLLAVCAVRWQRVRAKLIGVGLVFEVLVCLGVSINEFHNDHATAVARLISWTCVVIACFPVLCPAPRRWTLLASLAAALMTPVGWAIVSALDGRWDSGFGALSSRLVPPLLCVGIAYVAAVLINRLGDAVTRARRLGAYELVEKLGHGGMGEVWRARHNLLARPAAIKLIKRDALERGSRADVHHLTSRFEREAQVIASLESPHTITLFDFGVTDDHTLYYVMELLDGIDLESLVTRYGPLPPARVIHILQQVCDSLDEAHRAGLIHRDIKPANIHVGRRAGRPDFVKVLDFGLVKQFGLADGDPLTSTTTEIKGTPAYLAPEMIAGTDSELDARADLYALGCVAYFALTGELVFSASNSIGMMIGHTSMPPIPPSLRAGRTIPPELERVVLACLEKDPAARPQTARELADRLARVNLTQPWTEASAAAWWTEASRTTVDPMQGTAAT